MSAKKLEITIVGGGMITEVQLLPSLYHIQRQGLIGGIKICALNSAPLKTLAASGSLKKAFPGQSFEAFPGLDNPADKLFPDLYKEVIAGMEKYNVVVVAVPDHLHYGTIKYALEHDQHVLSVKPLCLEYGQSVELDDMARERGLVVGIEYHKRFDDRSLITRKRYRNGDFGEFMAGQAHLVEPQYYRHSNFQNWCTAENSDAFAYIGCHYIDLIHFITGLLPVEVSVYGKVDAWPNGRKGFLWTDGRVVWENGAVLSVLNGFGYPDEAPGGNSQGLYIFTQGGGLGGLINHSDQFRGVKHGAITCSKDPGDKLYWETNPDYFQLIYRGGEGYTPVGYGYRSVEYIINQIGRANREADGKAGAGALAKRQAVLKQLDDEGIMATPANSSFNELVMEAGRMSILNSGRPVTITYGDKPSVAFKQEFKKLP